LNKEELHKMLESDELHKAAVLVFANKQVTDQELSFHLQQLSSAHSQQFDNLAHASSQGAVCVCE